MNGTAETESIAEETNNVSQFVFPNLTDGALSDDLGWDPPLSVNASFDADFGQWTVFLFAFVVAGFAVTLLVTLRLLLCGPRFAVKRTAVGPCPLPEARIVQDGDDNDDEEEPSNPPIPPGNELAGFEDDDFVIIQQDQLPPPMVAIHQRSAPPIFTTEVVIETD